MPYVTRGYIPSNTTAVYSMADVNPVWYYIGSNQTGGTNVTPMQNEIWKSWCRDCDWHEAEPSMTITPPTPEEVERRERRLRERREREEERMREHHRRVREAAARTQAADQRARELLRLLLNDEEWEEYTNHQRVVIEGSDRNWYIVHMRGSYEGNVVQLSPGGSPRVTICCHPDMYPERGSDRAYNRIPMADAYAAQILAIRNDAEGFLDVGNYRGAALPPRSNSVENPVARQRRQRADANQIVAA